MITSDGVLEDMSLASRVLEDTFSSPWPCGTCPWSWPWVSGPWPCEIFNDTYVYWHRSEESSHDSCKDHYKCQFVPILTRCNNASDAFLSQVWCASTSSLTWRPSTGKGRHGTDFWVYDECPWPWESSPWPWSWPRGLCPWSWPCYLCPWLHHWWLQKLTDLQPYKLRNNFTIHMECIPNMRWLKQACR